MPLGRRRISDVVFELRSFQIARHNLSFGEGLKCCGVTDLTTEFYAGDCSPHIIWMGEEISLDLNRIARIGTRKTDPSPALRVLEPFKQGPAVGVRFKSVSVFWS
jgi:hypothetical protein